METENYCLENHPTYPYSFDDIQTKPLTGLRISEPCKKNNYPYFLIKSLEDIVYDNTQATVFPKIPATNNIHNMGPLPHMDLRHNSLVGYSHHYNLSQNKTIPPQLPELEHLTKQTEKAGYSAQYSFFFS